MLRRARYLVLLALLLASVQNAKAGTVGFRVRTASGGTLPGACSFTPKNLSGTASKIISAALKKSGADKAISYFPSYARNELRTLLRKDTPEYAIHVRCHTYFSVSGYTKSIGSVIMRMDTGGSTSSSYRYAAMLGILYEDGSIGWNALRATLSSGTFSITISSSIAAALSKSGRSCVILILGETYRWW
ncbi:MAG: hypothetical protein LBS72_07220 [Oscillospiraceae bacterium]|jgi:hypothetical protein|nr:hypothetical protein [Oscillospiraceae bacterium]